MDELEFTLIKHLIEKPYLYQKLKLDKNAFENPIARNFFSYIGITLTKIGVYVLHTHTVKFLENEQIKELFKGLGQTDILEIENFIKYIYEQSVEQTFENTERVILEEYSRRKMLEIAENMILAIGDRKSSSSELVRKFSVSMDKLLYQQEEDLISMSTQEMIQAELEQVRSGKREIYIPTGLAIIDDYTAGLPKPSLFVPLAMTKKGKSMLLYKIIINMLERGQTVALYTIETSDVETRKKILSLYSGIEYLKISKGEMTEQEKETYSKKLIEFEERFADKLFLTYNKGGTSVKEVEIYWGGLSRAGIYLDCICIDYMGLLKSNNIAKGKTEMLLDLPQELRRLSQKTNTIVICPQQLHSSVAKLDIQDISDDKIYYISTLAHEATVTCVLHSKDGEDDTKIKILRSRIHSTDEIYWFPEKDFNRCDIGQDYICENIRF
jgi:replicative DNA helicase